MDKRIMTAALGHQEVADTFDSIHHALSNMALNSGALAIGTGSKKKVLIAATINFLSNGVFKAKTTAEVDFTATTHDIAASAAAVKEAVYLMMLAADGTPSLVMGAVATGAGNAKLPEIPTTGTPVGYVRVAVAAGSTIFNATTDDLDAAHLTCTYVNLGFLSPKFAAIQ
jgi:hypothetical protein